MDTIVIQRHSGDSTPLMILYDVNNYYEIFRSIENYLFWLIINTTYLIQNGNNTNSDD